jgi:hypothetical protein
MCVINWQLVNHIINTHFIVWIFERNILIDIINNINGGIIDFSIINNGSVKCTWPF